MRLFVILLYAQGEAALFLVTLALTLSLYSIQDLKGSGVRRFLGVVRRVFPVLSPPYVESGKTQIQVTSGISGHREEQGAVHVQEKSHCV